MKTPFLPRCAAFLAALLLAIPAHAQSGSSYTTYYQTGTLAAMAGTAGSPGFEVPLERTGHGFSFKWRTTAGGPVNSSGGSVYPKGLVTATSVVGAGAVLRSFMVTVYLPSSYVNTPVTYYYNGQNYTTYTYTSVPFSCVEWWLTDTTAGQESTHYSGTPGATTDLRGTVWTQQGTGIANRYFAVSTSRLGHALAVGNPTSGAWTTLNSGMSIGTYSNGSSGTQVPLNWFIGSAPASSGDFFLADRTEGRKALMNQTYCVTSAWISDYSICPLAGITVYLPPAEARFQYVLNWSLPYSPPSVSASFPPTQATALTTATVNAGTQTIPANAAKITATIPIGASFSLTRSVDGAQTPAFVLTPALAASSAPKVWWVANTPPAIAWTPVTFAVSLSRVPRTFTVSQPSSVSPTTPPLGYRIPMLIEDYTLTGEYNSFYYFTVTALINPAEPITLLMSDNVPLTVPITLPVTDPSKLWVTDSWSWIGGEAGPTPPGTPGQYHFSLEITGPRADNLGALSITPPDGSAPIPLAGIGLSIGPGETRVDAWHPDITWSASKARWDFSLPYTGPTGDWLLHDGETGTVATQTLAVGITANFHRDLGYWPLEPRQRTLQISLSRWNTGGAPRLWLRQRDGWVAQVNPISSVDWAAVAGDASIWTNSDFTFEAQTWIRDGADYWLYDEETGEESPVKTHSQLPNFITWFALPTPGYLTGAIDPVTGTTHLEWPKGVADPAGAFEVQRRVNGLSTWQAIGTRAVSEADGSGILHFSDPNLVVGRVHTYRVFFTYGSGPALRRSARSNLQILTDWRDTDGLGLPDGWEMAYFGSIGHSATADSDGDGIDNAAEFAAGSNPNDLPPATRLRVLVSDRELSLPDPDDTKVELHWDAPPGSRVRGVRVEWSEGGGVWAVLGECSLTTTQFSKTGLVSRRPYRFRVVSLPQGGGSLGERLSPEATYEVPLLKAIWKRRVYSGCNWPAEFCDSSSGPVATKYSKESSFYEYIYINTTVKGGITEIRTTEEWGNCTRTLSLANFRDSVDSSEYFHETTEKNGVTTADTGDVERSNFRILQDIPTLASPTYHFETDGHEGTVDWDHTEDDHLSPVSFTGSSKMDPHDSGANSVPVIRASNGVWPGGTPGRLAQVNWNGATLTGVTAHRGYFFLFQGLEMSSLTVDTFAELRSDYYDPPVDSPIMDTGGNVIGTASSSVDHEGFILLTNPVSTAALIAKVVSNLQPFAADWDAPLLTSPPHGGAGQVRWGHWHGNTERRRVDYPYVRGTGFTAGPVAISPGGLASYSLRAAETAFDIERGEMRFEINPAAEDVDLLVTHTFQAPDPLLPTPDPNDDPEQNLPPPPPDHQLVKLHYPQYTTLSTVISIDPSDAACFHTSENGDHSIGLLPVDLAVDADRNGHIEFGTDTTSAQKPFRFWINDDHDDNENDDYLTGAPNHSDTNINGVRDLEDVTQVKFKIPQVLIDMAKAGTVQLGFKWKEVTQGSPSVRIWSGTPNLDRPDYLKDQTIALQTVNLNFFIPGSASLVSGAASVWLRNSLMNDATSDTVNLLMEGVTVGIGKLTFMIKVGTQESEGPSIDLKLLNVRQMYERGKITVEAPAVPDPWTSTSPPTPLTWVSDPWNWPPDIDPNADTKTIAYVHGWRMGYNECILWADTTFKRLWQLGFKGRFYSFKWPTYYAGNDSIPDDIDPSSLFNAPGGLTYNPSEYRAWLSGPALANFVNGLPNGNARYLIAHSMGNVVCGIALRNNMQVTRYAMCNSAMAAMAYNGNIQDVNYPYTPDTDAHAGTRAKFGLADKLSSVPTEIVNFNLGLDRALSVWDLNNQYFKPQTFFIHSYGYFPNFAIDEKLQYGIRLNPTTWATSKVVTEVPEAMGYVTQARSHAAGHYQALGNSVVSTVDMSAFGFGNEHSAEWLYSIQKTYPFWKEVLKKFDIEVTNR